MAFRSLASPSVRVANGSDEIWRPRYLKVLTCSNACPRRYISPWQLRSMIFVFGMLMTKPSRWQKVSSASRSRWSGGGPPARRARSSAKRHAYTSSEAILTALERRCGGRAVSRNGITRSKKREKSSGDMGQPYFTPLAVGKVTLDPATYACVPVYIPCIGCTIASGTPCSSRSMRISLVRLTRSNAFSRSTKAIANYLCDRLEI